MKEKMHVPHRGNPLWMGREYPELTQALEILNAVEVALQGRLTRYWKLHIHHAIEDEWLVINASHCIFKAQTEAEVASFVMGLFRATYELLPRVQAADRADREQELQGEDSPDAL